MLASTWNVAKTTSPSHRYRGSQEGALLLLLLLLPAAERRAEEGESAINRLGDERSFGSEACGVACRLCWCRGDVGDAMGAFERYRWLSEFRPLSIFLSRNEKKSLDLSFQKTIKTKENKRKRQQRSRSFLSHPSFFFPCCTLITSSLSLARSLCLFSPPSNATLSRNRPTPLHAKPYPYCDPSPPLAAARAAAATAAAPGSALSLASSRSHFSSSAESAWSWLLRTLTSFGRGAEEEEEEAEGPPPTAAAAEEEGNASARAEEEEEEEAAAAPPLVIAETLAAPEATAADALTSAMAPRRSSPALASADAIASARS